VGGADLVRGGPSSGAPLLLPLPPPTVVVPVELLVADTAIGGVRRACVERKQRSLFVCFWNFEEDKGRTDKGEGLAGGFMDLDLMRNRL
jgi:hypothetical protein